VVHWATQLSVSFDWWVKRRITARLKILSTDRVQLSMVYFTWVSLIAP